MYELICFISKQILAASGQIVCAEYDGSEDIRLNSSAKVGKASMVGWADTFYAHQQQWQPFK